jgi:hypothetical protein
LRSTPPSLKNKEGHGRGQRVSDHVSVLIGQFTCAAVAQSASSWGQARLSAVTDASCRTAAANFAGAPRAGFSKKLRSLQRDRAAAEGSDVGREQSSKSPVQSCAHPIWSCCPSRNSEAGTVSASRRDTSKPLPVLSLGERHHPMMPSPGQRPPAVKQPRVSSQVVISA